MPYYGDFKTLDDIKEIEINPFEWVNPIFIEYGTKEEIQGRVYYWRVKGTKHTFTILSQRINFLSSGDYAQHFTEVLKQFREDYLDWKAQEFNQEWMQEYRNEFARFIL